MVKTFTLRVDLESDKGIKAVPRLLNLLKKYNIKASFYLAMGGESNIFELLRYRKKLISSSERSISVWSLRDKIRMAFLPKNFVIGNINILRRILKEEHELGIHGWKHRAWTRGLDKINIRDHISKAKKRYFKMFGEIPESFCSPGFNINEKVIKLLENRGIKYISDFEGGEISKIKGMVNVPITIKGENKMPIIEYLSGKGYSDKEITDFLKKEILKKEISSFYIHGMYEARFKLNILEEIFKFIKEKRIKNKRIIDF